MRKGQNTAAISSILYRMDSKFERPLHHNETKCVSEFDCLKVIGEEDRFIKACTLAYNVVHTSDNSSILHRMDSKFENLLHTNETKCVSEFDCLKVIGYVSA